MCTVFMWIKLDPTLYRELCDIKNHSDEICYIVYIAIWVYSMYADKVGCTIGYIEHLIYRWQYIFRHYNNQAIETCYIVNLIACYLIAYIKHFFFPDKNNYIVIYCYNDMKFLIAWYTILLLSSNPNIFILVLILKSFSYITNKSPTEALFPVGEKKSFHGLSS